MTRGIQEPLHPKQWHRMDLDRPHRFDISHPRPPLWILKAAGAFRRVHEARLGGKQAFYRLRVSGGQHDRPSMRMLQKLWFPLRGRPGRRFRSWRARLREDHIGLDAFTSHRAGLVNTQVRAIAANGKRLPVARGSPTLARGPMLPSLRMGTPPKFQACRCAAGVADTARVFKRRRFTLAACARHAQGSSSEAPEVPADRPCHRGIAKTSSRSSVDTGGPAGHR